MGQLKKLLIDTIEISDEIKELLSRVKNATPAVFNLFFDESLESAAKKRHLYRFVNDEELVTITVAALEMGLVSKDTLEIDLTDITI